MDCALRPFFTAFPELQCAAGGQVFQSLRQDFRYVAGAVAEACGGSSELIGKGQEQVGKWNVIAVMEV